MKLPVTSLCRRPGKKTACGAVCPRCGNNFRPQGRSAEGRRNCRAKAAWMRAQKQPPARAGDCAQAAPMGERRTSCTGWCREASARAAHQGRGHAWAQKTAPSGGRGLCADCAMGERRAMERVWCRKATARAARRDRGYARAQKQPPAGTGGCLDAGYGCYLPRAIRVIWMHRVGSTARPRIMPS